MLIKVIQGQMLSRGYIVIPKELIDKPEPQAKVLRCVGCEIESYMRLNVYIMRNLIVEYQCMNWT